MELQRIENSTPVREFPDIYNGNIDKLVEEINELNAIINDKDKKIKELEEYINRVKNNLESTIAVSIDTRFDGIENELDKKISKMEEKINSLKSRIYSIDSNLS